MRENYSWETVRIDGGQAFSTPIDLASVRSIEKLHMPAAWSGQGNPPTSAITVQVAREDMIWRDLYSDEGGEFAIVAAASRAISSRTPDVGSERFLRYRSGTRQDPVVQAQTRLIDVLVLRVVDEG